MRRDEGIPPYSCRVIDAGRRVADPYNYFVYVSATLSTVKHLRFSEVFFYAVFYFIRSFFLMKSIVSSTVVKARATVVSAAP